MLPIRRQESSRFPLVERHETRDGLALVDRDTILRDGGVPSQVRYRVQHVSRLDLLRERPVEGSAGVTLSGSGPSVVVWAEPHRAAGVVRALRKRLLRAQVLPLAIADRGTHPVHEPIGATA